MPEQIVKAPMKARVIRFHFEAGATLKERDRVCDLEALKMEVPIMAPVAGTLKQILSAPGKNVQSGEPLFSIES